MPDVMRLWDTLLTDRNRFTFLTYFCVAVVLSIRNELIEKNDFAFCVKARGTLHLTNGRVTVCGSKSHASLRDP